MASQNANSTAALPSAATEQLDAIPRASRMFAFLPSCRLRELVLKVVQSPSAISICDQAVVSGTSFVTSVLLGRLCGRDELGVYSLAMTLVLFVQGIQDQVICTPYMIFAGRRNGRDLQTYSGSSLFHQLLLTLLSMLGLAVAGWFLPQASGWGATMFVLVAVTPFLLFREFVRQFSMARLQPRMALAVDCLVSFVQLLGLLACGLGGWLSIPVAFGMIGGACLLSVVGWFVLRKSDFAVHTSTILPDWKQNWAFARWPLAGQFTGSATPYILPWLLVACHGEAAAGLFAACSTLVGLSRMFVSGVNNIVIPKAARAYAEVGTSGLCAILRNTTLVYATTLGAFSLIVLGAGEWLAVSTFGAKYSGGGTVMTLLALNVLATALSQTAGNGLFAVLQPRANFVADIVLLVATLLAAACCIPTWGASGAAAATLIGTTIAAVWRSLTLRFVLRELSRQPAVA